MGLELHLTNPLVVARQSGIHDVIHPVSIDQGSILLQFIFRLVRCGDCLAHRVDPAAFNLFSRCCTDRLYHFPAVIHHEFHLKPFGIIAGRDKEIEMV